MTQAITHSLKSKNTFSIGATTDQIFCPETIEDLHLLPDLSQQAFYVLGEGSNTLFTEEKAPIIVCPNIKGINVTETETDYLIKVGASENWHNLVKYCIAGDMFGLENLALIPGSVGAAPVQNIGAYGVEFADICWSVDWYDFSNKTMNVLKNEACDFGYRDSIFKQALANQGLITHVTLKLSKKWQANLSYQGLDLSGNEITARDIFLQVIKLRQSKLPDPKLLPNAGSFFKNPIVSSKKVNELKEIYPGIPVYQQSNNAKLAAGWLIEKCGLKGYRTDTVGVHDKQALVLVNYDKATGNQIVELARHVQYCVYKKFDITLEPEVKMVTSQGEVNFEKLSK